VIGTTSCGPALSRQLVVDVLRRCLHPGRHRYQVADAFEERAVGGHVDDRPGVGDVPGIDLGLQPLTLGQQR
jgi:hypothetical protein